MRHERPADRLGFHLAGGQVAVQDQLRQRPHPHTGAGGLVVGRVHLYNRAVVKSFQLIKKTLLNDVHGGAVQNAQLVAVAEGGDHMPVAVRVFAVFRHRCDRKAEVTFKVGGAEVRLRCDMRIDPVTGHLGLIIGVDAAVGGVNAGRKQVTRPGMVQINRRTERFDGAVRMQAHAVGIHELPCGKAVCRKPGKMRDVGALGHGRTPHSAR